MVKRKKGFTLIELIAVLVIMAILALVVTPLVMSIIRKARVSADKRSIDAYGRSIELAIAGYLLDHGTFPTEVSQLTIEYSGSVVECETTQINSDSSIYLAGCRVAGRSVENYAYGHDLTPPATTYEAYSVGDEVTYNNVAYRVIKDSSTSESTVTLLKAEPLSYSDIQTYSAGTGASISDQNGYGGIQYGTTSSYATSYAKATVDAWKAAQAPAASEARLMTYDEYTDNAEVGQICTGSCYDAIVPKYGWMYNSNYWYWTNTPSNDSSSNVWSVSIGGDLDDYYVSYYIGVVRPVIVLSKSNISS